MKCVHHGDLDGRASAGIFCLVDPDAIFIEADYRNFPLEQIEEDDEIVIVDYSCQSKELWEKVFKLTSSIVWLDHHETSLNNFKKWFPGRTLRGIQTTEKCGAILAWDWCFPGKIVPEALSMIDKWDRWEHNDNTRILNFQAGTEIMNDKPDSVIWKDLFIFNNKRMVSQLVSDGHIVRKYKQKSNKENLEKYSFEMEWEGHKCIVLNGPDHGSKTFDSVKGEYDITMTYIFDGTLYEVHLYSDTVKVNEIALANGGGGHPGAAGFECKELPWSKQWVE